METKPQEMQIHVAFVTTGRAEILAQSVARLARQTRLADRIVVVGAQQDDLPSLGANTQPVTMFTSAKGASKQRNAALDYIGSSADIVVFFDDDFFAADDYLENVERIFREAPDVVGLTGVLMADGAHTGSLTPDEADTIIEMGKRPSGRGEERTSWLYGCNMAVRYAAARDVRFDEALPLYSWQEDVDYSSILARNGRLLRTPELTGVHMGVLRGRTSGVKFGYSQVANVLYLRQKGTMRPYHGWQLMLRNIASNIVRSMKPEPLIDRRGRLRGNMRALRDLTKGEMDPRRIETF